MTSGNHSRTTRVAYERRLSHTVPLTGMRGAIATLMSQSIHEMAQFTMYRRVDTTAMLEHRSQWSEVERPSINDVVLAATARALTRHPAVNATLEDGVISCWKSVHLGMVVAVEVGLLVPIIRDADQIELSQLRDETRRLAAAAHQGALTLADLQGATFTVSNLGSFGIDAFMPIVNPPQVGILGVGRLVAKEITLSLTVDHRAVDGVPGAIFLGDVVSMLEAPGELFAGGATERDDDASCT